MTSALSIIVHYHKILFLTLVVALATLCGFAQEKIWDNVVTGYRTSTVFDVNADPRNLDALENVIKTQSLTPICFFKG